MKPSKLAILFVAVGCLVVLADRLLGKAPQAALLLNLAFWTAICQGCVALVAAADLAEAKWIVPVRKELLALTPLMLFCAGLFLFMAPHWHIYPLEHARGAWFGKNLFLGRNFAILFIASLLALKYRREILKNSPSRHTWGVLYLLAFVATQSMIAFDWLMPLEYPWINTLLGGFFFVEALYVGLACSGMLCLILHLKARALGAKPQEWAKAQYDTGVMLFGFGTLWIGLFFAQFIVIWYGNLPEEVMFLTRRLSVPAYKITAFAVLAAMFVLPFFTLMIRRAKRSAYAVAAISTLVICGLFAERYFFIAPAAPIAHPSLVLQFALIAILVAVVVKAHYAAPGNPR